MKIKSIMQHGDSYSEFYCIIITDANGDEFKSNPMTLCDVMDFMNVWQMNH